MNTVNRLLTQHLEIWSAAENEKRSRRGRTSGGENTIYGVRKLRDLILEFAVRGKLVAQVDIDEPAKALLKKIDFAKAALIASKKLKNGKALATIASGEMPFSLPKGWEWVRLGEITNFGETRKPQSIPDETWVLDLEDIEKDTSKLLQKSRFSERRSLSDKNSFVAGDVLYGKLRPYLNKVIVADEDGICTTEILPIRCHGPMDSDYLKFALKAPNFINYVNARSYGMKMPRLGTEDGRNACLSLPPLAEQHRIVAKIEELMALCDQLESRHINAAEAHEKLVSHLLSTLTQSQDADDFNVNWQRIASHFDTLFTTEDSIEELKQTLLQLAVMGKLVPQDANDEPASDSYKQIQNEKAILIAKGTLKTQRSLPEIISDEKPFEVPSGWEWHRIGSLISLISGKGFNASEYSDKGIRLFQIANVSLGFTNWDIEKFLPLKYLDLYPDLALAQGDVLIALNRPLLNRRMKVCILREEDLPAILYQRVGKFICHGDNIDHRYFYFFLQSTLFIHHLDGQLQGSDQPFINQSQLIKFLFPLPPLVEQHRIVAKVDELMALCDRLKGRIANKDRLQQKLADVLVAQAVA